MAGYDALILIDIARQGHPPGTLYTIEPDEDEVDRQIAAGATLDLHGMNPTAVLRFVKQVSGELPEQFSWSPASRSSSSSTSTRWTWC